MSKKNINLKRAVIYARFSSDRQREESITGQIRECTAYANSNGLSIVNTYIDRAKSAKTDHRPDFQRMIKDSTKHLFDYIIVYSLDRFSRNRYDSATYKNRLKKNGVKVLSAKENIGADPSGIILESVIEGMAEYYSAELAEKVTRGMRENALEGKFTGGAIPFGYKVDKDRHLIIDPVEAPVIKKIFDMYLGHYPITKIVRYLKEKHVVRKNGKPLTYTSLLTILHNELYTGTYKWADVEIKNNHEPLVSAIKFLKVKEIMSLRGRHIGRVNDKSYPLSGKTKCGSCGSTMDGVCGTSRDGTRHHYYACHARQIKHICKAPYIKKDTLEKLVLTATINLLDNPANIHFICNTAIKVLGQKKQTNQPEILSLQARIKDISKKLENCVQAIEGGLHSNIVTTNIEKYENELVGLNNELDKEKIKSDAPLLTLDRLEFFFDKLLSCKKNMNEYKEKILHSFISEVLVFEDFIEIRYSYGDLPTFINTKSNSVRIQKDMVGDIGFEPTTPSMSTRYSNQLS